MGEHWQNDLDIEPSHKKPTPSTPPKAEQKNPDPDNQAAKLSNFLRAQEGLY